MNLILDIETTGLSFSKDSVICVGFRYGKDERVLFDVQEFMPILGHALENKNTIVTHNGTAFDLPFLLRQARPDLRERFIKLMYAADLADTLTLSRLLTAQAKGHSVEAWAQRLQESGINVPSKPPIEDFKTATVEEITHRVKCDIAIQSEIYLNFKDAYKDLDNIPAYKALRPFMPVAIEMLTRGVPVNMRVFGETLQQLEKDKANISKEIANTFGKMNPQSSQQIDKALWSKYKKRLPQTGQGNPSFSQTKYPEILRKIPQAKVFMDYKETVTQLSFLKGTGAKNFKNYLRNDRIHPAFSFVSQRLLRSSYSRPPINQMDKRLRTLICGGSGRSLLGIDIQSLEFKMIAIAFEKFAKDTTLMSEWEQGLNPKHETLRVFSSLIPAYLSEERRLALAKTIFYGLSYGAGAGRVCEMLEIPASEANLYVVSNCINARLKGRYKLQKYFEEQIKEEGFIRTLQGVPVEAVGHSHLNTFCQASGAIYSYLCLGHVVEYLKDICPTTEVVLFNHDEINVSVPHGTFFHEDEIFDLQDYVNEHLKTKMKVLARVEIKGGETWRDSH